MKEKNAYLRKVLADKSTYGIHNIFEPSSAPVFWAVISEYQQLTPEQAFAAAFALVGELALLQQGNLDSLHLSPEVADRINKLGIRSLRQLWDLRDYLPYCYGLGPKSISEILVKLHRLHDERTRH